MSTLGLGMFSRGGLVVSLKVTCLVLAVGSVLMAGVGLLLSSSSDFWSASIFANPFSFCFPFNACVRLLSALTIVSARVREGWVMYFVLKNTMFVIRLCRVPLTYILWHW